VPHLPGSYPECASETKSQNPTSPNWARKIPECSRDRKDSLHQVRELSSYHSFPKHSKKLLQVPKHRVQEQVSLWAGTQQGTSRAGGAALSKSEQAYGCPLGLPLQRGSVRAPVGGSRFSPSLQRGSPRLLWVGVLQGYGLSLPLSSLRAATGWGAVFNSRLLPLCSTPSAPKAHPRCVRC
jgi:hypothetical protein